MRIAQLHIENVLGIEYLDYEAGRFNRIKGDNGTGKTSVSEALRAALKGGHDATLLRNGATEAQVVVVFDDGTEVTKTITHKESKSEVTGTRRPAEYLDRVRDLTSINPADILFAKADKRLEYLLESVTFDFDWGAFEKLVQSPITNRNDPLDRIDFWRKSFYDERTGSNRELKSKEITLADHRRSAIDVPESAPQEAITGFESSLVIADTKRDLNKQNLVNRSHKESVDLKNKLDVAIAALRNTYDTQLAVLKSNYESSLGDIMEKHSAEVAPIQQNLAQTKESLRTYDKAIEQQTIITRLEKEVAELHEESDRHTKTIEKIDAFKEGLLKSLPFKGVNVIGGEIYIDGVIWDRVNEARKALFANEIAKRKAKDKDLKLICWDRMGMLSPKTLEELAKSTEDDGFQYWVGIVTSDPEMTITPD